MSNNPPPNIIWLQWDGDAETPEPCTDDPDDRDVTWCRERVFNRDIQFERSDRITELKRELEQERQDRKQADLDAIRALGERNEARLERDTALRDLAAERALADRLAGVLLSYDHDMLAGEDMQWLPEHDEALAAWKEARRGSV